MSNAIVPDTFADRVAAGGTPLGTFQNWFLLGRIWALIEHTFCLFAISILAGAYILLPDRLAGASAEIGVSNPYNRVANEVILICLGLLCIIYRRRFLLVSSRGHLVNLFVLFAFASTFWSLDLEVTLRRSVTLLDAVLLAYYLVARFPIEHIIRMLAITFVLAAVASAIVSLGMPEVGVMHEGELQGDWNGVFTHKQSLGVIMALGCLCCGWLLLHEKEGRTFNAVGLAVCLSVALMSGSRTSMIEILLFPVMGQCVRLLRLPGVLRLWVIYCLILCGVVIATLLYGYFDAAMELLDKDPTLTGRAPLWALLLKIAADRPLLGHGYGAFWLPDNTLVQYIWSVIGWSSPQAHNSYLDALVDLGVPGLALSCVILISVTYRSLLGMWRGSPTWSSFAVLYAFTALGMGFVETGLLHAGDIECVLLVLLYVSLRSSPRQSVLRSGRQEPLASRP